MVLSLADLIKEEDSNFVQGSCAMLLKNFDPQGTGNNADIDSIHMAIPKYKDVNICLLR